ncbi:IclR family transcriptional regulator [Comamonas endophytica]|uniref:IclR family transcriptional regulator n=1 Tax=Comamonas endophytica TaxID=2949090 RepID=A0ABY6GEN4_9BURK|nr:MULTISPECIES: IclR family transcriptional regulator [unclassified Acidovorax]MCD2513284.1 IclR family transcriptional regulator [Acidovorax sp. D4N7]UYG53373.1 IclR family transcriptional regulator [Acidovorax sp. 5MLIR]
MTDNNAADKAESDKSEGGVRAVQRALDILLAFKPADDGLLVSELLKRVDLSRPTLYRLLDTLDAKGFLVSEGEPQRFRLGPAVAQLAHAWSSGTSYETVAHPMMRRLWESTRETVSLHVQEGTHRVCVAELPSTQPLSFRRGVGYREMLVRGASGRSILAWLDPKAADLSTYGAQNAADAKRVMQQLGQIRQQGYAMSRDELIQGAVAIAAPFFESSGRVVGSLGLFGPSARLSEELVQRYGAMLMHEAQQLSAALGFKAAAGVPNAN